MKHGFAEALSQWPEVFLFSGPQVVLNPRLEHPQQRTDALREVNLALVASGAIDRTHGERYPVKREFHEPNLALIDRAAVPYYGIRAWGQHLNGYVKKGNGLYMWIAKRALDKPTFPGMLDNLVAGGLPADIHPRDNVVKECREEASIPLELTQQIVATGAISYCVEIPKGLKPDIMFCYDLELPESFQPVCQDGEVESFQLMPLQEVAEIVRDTGKFKRNCNLTIIDFLLRHGYFQPEDPDYMSLLIGLRQSFKFRL